MPTIPQIPIGTQFTRWTVIGPRTRDHRGASQYLCHCTCGTERVVLHESLVRGKSQSCGCLAQETLIACRLTHNLSHTLEYHIWLAIRKRCKNASQSGYKDYGGRGIYVCERWEASFEGFIADMGFKPETNSQIDRIDNDGPYSPENCRWVSQKVNSRNKRTTRFLKAFGETKSLPEWAEDPRCVVSADAFHARIYRKWDVETALMRPMRGY